MNRLLSHTARLKFLFSLLLLVLTSNVFAQEKPIVCGTDDSAITPEVAEQMRMLPQIMQKQNARISAGEMTVCRISVDIDSYTYLQYEKDTSAIIQKVIENIQKCSQLYELEINTRLVVTSIRILKDTDIDPYAATSDVSTQLGVLANRPVSDFNFDKRVYLYTKPPTSGPVGVAYIGGGYNVSPLEGVGTIIHELAHNFGSVHTNDCAWPGGPIDYCGIEGSCYDKSLETSTFGYILSRCGNGQTFHPLCKAIIKNHAETYFSKILAAPEAIQLPSNLTVAKGYFYAWPASIHAKFYQLSYSLQSDFSTETVVTTPFNGLQLLALNKGSEYFVRVRAINSLALTNWSNVIKIKIDPDQPDTPVPSSPALNSIVPGFQPVTLSFSSVPGATSYQIQVTGAYDPDFSYPSNEIITQNQFTFTPYYGAYNWRVKAIQGTKKGEWSAISFFSANPKLNIGLFMPIPSNMLNAPRTFPFSYQPSDYYAKVRITVADNLNFTNPLFQKNYAPFLEFTDVLKNLPANKELFFRVQERNRDLSKYPDRDFIDYIVRFTTGSDTSPSGLTFLNGIDQPVFGYTNQKITLSNDHVWFAQVNQGFIKMNQESLTYEVINRENSAGLLGVGVEQSIHADNNLNIHILNNSLSNSFLQVKLANEVPSASAEISRFYFSGYIQDHNPVYKLYWTQREIYKESDFSLSLIKQISQNQYINQIKIYNNKAWILLVNTNTNSSEIMVMDLNDPNSVQKIDHTTSPAIADYIQQIEIQSDGKVWLRQVDVNSNVNSIAFFNGTSWSGFNSGNSLFGTQITGLSISPLNKAYVLASGSQTQVYKYNGTSWEKAGDAFPYQNFGGDLWVDKHENFWISNVYGLSRFSFSPPLPVTLIRFEAVQETSSVALRWEVADEIDMAKYLVEHSKDGKSFSPFAEVTANKNTFYSTIHATPSKGINYYRLKSLETDNDFAYSKIISINFSGNNELVLFPNPTSDQIRVKVTSNLIGQPAHIRFVASDGKEIFNKNVEKLKATETLDVSNITGGTYVIRIENERETTSKIVEVIK